ncbi:DUF4132 domain-containing protein [Lentzea sp. CA-135723]|uniref:DUF4132 domain-containing protein n=1 Tax=Lentzea sp. CA-135723 TaxID=3239950 RepID=UPI003D93DD13
MGRWELVSGNSAKFWEVTQNAETVTVRFGRLGTAGQTQTKELTSTAAATAHVAKLVAEKEKKGYQKAAAPTGPTSATAGPAAAASTADSATAVPSATAPTNPAPRGSAATNAKPAAAPSAPRPAAPNPAAESASPTTAKPAATNHIAPPTPLDEDTWGMPAEWLAQARRRRDVHPAPTFTVDRAQAQQMRAHAAAHTEKVEEALTSGQHESALAQALRAHHRGEPDPLGAATLLKLIGWDHQTSPLHWWIEDYGLPFAAVAAVHLSTVSNTHQGLMVYLPHSSWDDQTLIDARTALAATDDATFAQAVSELEKLDPNWFVQAARAFLVPSRRDWFTEAKTTGGPNWLIHASGTTLEDFSGFTHGNLLWSVANVYTALHVLGPAVARVLDAELRAKSEWNGDNRQRALEVLSVLPTDEAFLMLLSRLHERLVRPVLVSAMKRFPARALRLMAPRAAEDADVRNLLRAHVLTRLGLSADVPPTHPGPSAAAGTRPAPALGTDLPPTPPGPALPADLPLKSPGRELSTDLLPTPPGPALPTDRLPTPPGLTLSTDLPPKSPGHALPTDLPPTPPGPTRPTDRLPTPPNPALPTDLLPARVPDAPAEALPRVLAEPPWTHRRPQPKPVVLKDLPVPAPTITWLPGERDEWLALKGWWTARHGNWEPLAERMREGRYPTRDDHQLFESAPEDLARPLLAGWTPTDTWRSEGWGRRITARFELDALPPMLRLAASNPHVSGVVLLPYATAEVAALMADWFVRLKSARAFAVSWLARHRDTAARLLLPSALGPAGPARRNAEFALRHLHLETDVVALATALSPEAGAAIRALIEIDPVDVLPSKLPAVGAWADVALLPQVLLADCSGALPAAATKNLLMTAALSKQDAVYAGLPPAVEACDRSSLAEFGWALFGRWLDVGSPAKDGWALTALGWFGDDETVRRLAPLIRLWPGEAQHARAVAALDVLAQIGSEAALTALNSIAERVKFKGLKAKAQEKVTDIAAALGLSRDQLSDRLVPRFGLDEAATLVIDYGPRQFTVGFDEQLKPFVLNPDGKRRKDLPKPGARDDQELAPAEHKRFATLKKDVRSIAADLIHRLERSMVDQRTWTAEEFHTVLAGHPLLAHLARRLVWITDTGTSFRLAEDRTLADVNDDEFTLPDTATVRLAHPVHLAERVDAWGRLFADYELLQPFLQLGRPTHAFAPGDVIPQLGRYLDRDAPVGKVLGLTKRGWLRCQPQDNGIEPWMTRPLPSGGALVASLDPGIAVGMVDLEPEQRFHELWYSATGEGAWVAPREGLPTTFEVDEVTASELLSELESLHA